MPKKKILVAVTNDVSTDQRIYRVCHYLEQKGFEITIYGRLQKDSLAIQRPYKVLRTIHWFQTNFLFYAEYNIRLLLFLLRFKFDYILSNDLDTLPACYLSSRLKKCHLVFDAHELFTEVPELQGRKFVQNFWKGIERMILPNLKHSYTVSQQIADAYSKKYQIKMGVVKNVPFLNNAYVKENIKFPTKHKVLLYQGILSEARGLKPAIKALDHLPGVDLVIIGFGKEKENLIRFVKAQHKTERVHFLGRIPFEKLPNYTQKADIGIMLEESVGKSFQFSLPNKLFDYIHSGLPILASDLRQFKDFVGAKELGLVVKNHEPKELALHIELLLNDAALRERIKKNQQKIKSNFCWEKEREKLDAYFL